MASSSSYIDRLSQAAASMEINLDDACAAALIRYLEELQRWNRTYNLTALRDPEQMLVQHLFDSLAVLPSIENTLYKNTAEGQPLIVDVGSGAGLPGAVLAIVRPAWQVRCIDAVEKKTAFVRQAASVLRIGNLKAMHERVERIPSLEANVVVSRAFASLLDFATLAGHHVGSTGHLVAMKGQDPVDEIQALQDQTDWRVTRVEPISVPELHAQRCLVWMSREGNHEPR